MIKVMQTRNYEMFELMPFNRDVEKTRHLERSMSEHGWIDAYPLHVKRNGGTKFLIKAGHHRYHVAKKLGIPVKFVVCDDDATIHELEKSTCSWTMKDYLISYCRLGKEDYIRVKSYCDTTGIGLQNAVSMLGGHSAGSGNFTKAFKDGTFKINDRKKHAETVKGIILHCTACGIKFAPTYLFVQSISKVAQVGGFDIQRFKAKIKTFAQFMEKKANLQQYLELIEEIYNRQAREKIPLAFLATQAARERNVIKVRKP
jgi:hypothetical protein